MLLLALAIAIAGCSNIQGRRAFDEAAWKRLCEVRKLALEEMHNRNIDPAKCIEAGFEYRDSKWLLVYLGEHHTDHFVISVDANNHVNFAPGLQTAQPDTLALFVLARDWHAATRERIFREVFDQYWQYVQCMPERTRHHLSAGWRLMVESWLRRLGWIGVPAEPQSNVSTNSNPFFSQNQFCTTAINEAKQRAKDAGAENIRKNQVQTDVNGNRVGDNRPDVQYDLKGTHYNAEYDTTQQSSLQHQQTVNANDPDAVNTFKVLKKP